MSGKLNIFDENNFFENFLKFKNLNDKSKKEFILKYYPLILRTQQKEEGISKMKFLIRHFRNPNSENNNNNNKNKFLISESSYKRYLKKIEGIDFEYEKDDKGDVTYLSWIEPKYSTVNIPKLQTRNQDEIVAKLLSFESTLELIWSNITPYIRDKKSRDDKIKTLEKHHKSSKQKVEQTMILLQKSGLFDLVSNTLNSMSFKGTLTDNLVKLGITEKLHAEQLLYYGEEFLKTFKAELYKTYRIKKNSETEFDNNLDNWQNNVYKTEDDLLL